METAKQWTGNVLVKVESEFVPFMWEYWMLWSGESCYILVKNSQVTKRNSCKKNSNFLLKLTHELRECMRG